MNPSFIPIIVGTLAFFYFGIRLSRKACSRLQNGIVLAFGVFAAMPAILFVVYYTSILGEAEWFYAFRAAPGTEFSVCGLGLLAGWFQVRRAQSSRICKQMSVAFIPFMLLLCITVPYLKQIFLRPEWDSFNDRWSNDVCLQSSESSCGPASAATLFKFYGLPASEKQIAQESFTSRRGTENWYLIRTLRRHGLNARYSIHEAGKTNLPFPAIVGVRLGGKNGGGHFIAILGKSEDRFVVGDPLNGREELDASELLQRYYFTGFSILTSSNPL